MKRWMVMLLVCLMALSPMCTMAQITDTPYPDNGSSDSTEIVIQTAPVELSLPDTPENYSDERKAHKAEEQRQADSVGGTTGSPYWLNQAYVNYESLDARMYNAGGEQVLFKEKISWEDRAAGTKQMDMRTNGDERALVVQFDQNALETLHEAAIVQVNIGNRTEILGGMNISSGDGMYAVTVDNANPVLIVDNSLAVTETAITGTASQILIESGSVTVTFDVTISKRDTGVWADNSGLGVPETGVDVGTPLAPPKDGTYMAIEEWRKQNPDSNLSDAEILMQFLE